MLCGARPLGSNPLIKTAIDSRLEVLLATMPTEKECSIEWFIDG